MKFTVNTLALQKALIPFNELEFSRNGTDISSMIKLNLASGILTFSMNIIMQKINMKTELQVQGSEDGTVLLSYNDFWSNISIIEAENISIELNDSNILAVSADNKTIEINTIPDNLKIDTIETENKKLAFEISGKDFKQLIRQTIRCTSDDRMRPALTGILFNKVEDKLEAVACNGYIMAANSIPHNKEFEPLIIKKESLYISQKYVQKDASVKLYTDGNSSIISFENICIEQELIQASFPNYQALMERECVNKTFVSKSDFDDALRVFANITADQDYPEMKIAIEGNKFAMSCESSDISISCSENSPSYIAYFNVKLLMNIVSSIDANELEINYEENKYLIIKINNSDSYKALIVPLSK